MKSHVRIKSVIMSSIADAASTEVLLLENEIFYAPGHVIPKAYESSFPDLQQLLKSDSFKQNITLTLNISTANLTGLLNTQLQDPNQTLDHISSHQPPSMPILVTLTVFYALIFVAGVLGNLITCIVISRNKFMHTATNFYLFNLAVSDLILLLSGAPQDLYNFWYPNAFPFTDALCILHSILAETATNATVLTITAFTVERYIAICHPFRQHTMSKLSRAIKFIFAIWIAALLLALPQAMQFSVVQDQGGTSCTIDNNFVAHVFAVSGFIFFGGPMTAICVLYVLIGIKLKRSRLLQAGPRRSYDVHRGISAQGRVIRMLVAVAVAFFICWAPFHAQRLMAVYGSTASIKSKLFKDVFETVDYTSSVLYYLSTCINPLLYNIMSHKFRDAFKVTLARHFGFPGRYQGQSHNYSAIMRQNGSMRLHTTDSIRTTTTTTTINSANIGGNTPGGNGSSVSCRSAHQTLSTSIGPQAASASLCKHNAHNFYPADCRNNIQPLHNQHHQLQSQISQVSSVGDANSLLEAELDEPYHQCSYSHLSNSCRLKDLKHSLPKGRKCDTMPTDDKVSINSRALKQHTNFDVADHHSGDEIELFKNTSSPRIRRDNMAVANTAHQNNSIAELNIHPPTRSRLKLSRIISRRNQDMPTASRHSRVKAMRTPALDSRHLKFEIDGKETPIEEDNNRGKASRLKGHKKIGNLAQTFLSSAHKKDAGNGCHNDSHEFSLRQAPKLHCEVSKTVQLPMSATTALLSELPIKETST